MNESAILPMQRELHGDAMTLAGYRDATFRAPAFYAARGGRVDAIRSEYEAIRSTDGVAIIDRSWRAAIEITGRDRHTFLQGMVSNDVASLAPGQGCRAELLNITAHILADLSIYCFPESLFVAMDARTIPTACATLEKFLIAEKVRIASAAGVWAVIGVTGGTAASVVAKITGSDAPATPFGCAQSDALRVTRWGRRGSAGYEIWTPIADSGALWKSLIEGGAIPVGEEAAEVTRVEDADPAWDTELEPSILLPETELREVMSFTKGCYVGQEIVARIRARGHTNKSLRQIRFEPGDNTMQAGDPIYPDVDDLPSDKECGRITSVVTSPVDETVTALAYIRKDFAAHGAAVICRYAHREAYGTVVDPNAAS